jgi:hypothetical protein
MEEINNNIMNARLKLYELWYRRHEIEIQQKGIIIAKKRNRIAAKRNRIAAGEAARRAEKQALDLANKLNDKFQDMLSITISLGSLMMLVVCGVVQWHSRHVSESLALSLWLACGSGPKPRLAWYDVPGPLLHQAKIVWCYASGVGNAFIALMALLSCTWALFRFEVLNQYKAIKVLWMSLVLGMLCGWLGYAVVASLGGNALVWVLIWEVWCLSHAGLSILGFSTTQTTNGTTKLTWIYSRWWMQVFIVSVLALVLPMTMAVLPFAERVRSILPL